RSGDQPVKGAENCQPFTLIRPAATFSLREKESCATRLAKRLVLGAMPPSPSPSGRGQGRGRTRDHQRGHEMHG
ncbi:MAG: hypothetical protein QGG72_12440, partial [Verrucomicrobiota bacterium]|nr:hypothetical protein [Verrucomicrobiota bacterium]